MKKIMTFIAFAAVIVVEARVCTSSCYVSAGGYGIGMGWNVPNGTACSGTPPRGAIVHYAYAASDYVFEQGVINGWEQGMSVGC